MGEFGTVVSDDIVRWRAMMRLVTTDCLRLLRIFDEGPTFEGLFRAISPSLGRKGF